MIVLCPSLGTVHGVVLQPQALTEETLDTSSECEDDDDELHRQVRHKIPEDEPRAILTQTLMEVS